MKKLIQCPNCGFELTVFTIDELLHPHIEEKPFEKQIKEACERAARTGDIWDVREWMRLKRNEL